MHNGSLPLTRHGRWSCVKRCFPAHARAAVLSVVPRPRITHPRHAPLLGRARSMRVHGTHRNAAACRTIGGGNQCLRPGGWRPGLSAAPQKARCRISKCATGRLATVQRCIMPVNAVLRRRLRPSRPLNASRPSRERAVHKMSRTGVVLRQEELNSVGTQRLM